MQYAGGHRIRPSVSDNAPRQLSGAQREKICCFVYFQAFSAWLVLLCCQLGAVVLGAQNDSSNEMLVCTHTDTKDGCHWDVERKRILGDCRKHALALLRLLTSRLRDCAKRRGAERSQIIEIIQKRDVKLLAFCFCPGSSRIQQHKRSSGLDFGATVGLFLLK